MEYKATLAVEATFGVKARAGDMVQKGAHLGTACDMRTPVRAPFAGCVRSITFDAERHTFVIELVATWCSPPSTAHHTDTIQATEPSPPRRLETAPVGYHRSTSPVQVDW